METYDYRCDVRDPKGRAQGVRLEMWPAQDPKGIWFWRLQTLKDGQPFGALRKVHQAVTKRQAIEHGLKAVGHVQRNARRRLGGSNAAT